METDDVKVYLELTVEEAATIAAALGVAKSCKSNPDFYRCCMELRAKIVAKIGRAVMGIFPFGNY